MATEAREVILAQGPVEGGTRYLLAIVQGTVVQDYRVRVRDDRGNTSFRFSTRNDVRLAALAEAMTVFRTGEVQS